MNTTLSRSVVSHVARSGLLISEQARLDCQSGLQSNLRVVVAIRIASEKTKLH